MLVGVVGGVFGDDAGAVVVSPAEGLVVHLPGVGGDVLHGAGGGWVEEGVDLADGFVG